MSDKKNLFESIQTAFGQFGLSIVDPVVMTKCYGVCTGGVEPDKLARTWEAWATNNPKFKTMTQQSFERFLRDEQQQLQPQQQFQTPAKRGERPVEDVTPPTSGSVSLSKNLFDQYGMVAPANAPSTPIESSKKRQMPSSSVAAALKSEAMYGGGSSQSPSSSQQAVPSDDRYAKRQERGKVVLHYNKELADVVLETMLPTERKRVVVVDASELGAYKFMWDQLESRANVFKDTQNRLGNLLISQHENELDGVEMGAFHLPRTEEVVCFGKICCGADDNKLEARSVLLEGQAPENDNIYRVKLDLKACPSFALFPGQIVALRGVNPSGSSLVVRRLLTDAALPLATTLEEDVFAGGSVKVTVAAGPFCSHGDLSYQPLIDLMDVVLSNGTDVLVLMGPFVDAKHPEIERGSIAFTYEDFFVLNIHRLVLERVGAHNSVYEKRGTLGRMIRRVVLIPSLQDLHHHAAAFPQFPFPIDLFVDRSGKDFERGVREFRELVLLASNPAQLRINGVLFGFTTVDPLKHMGSVALVQRPADTKQPSRIVEMASLLLEQQSFLPMNPPPVECNLDTTHMAHVEFGETSRGPANQQATPQILVLPSALKEFVEPVKGSLVVNPSLLVRGGSGGGTFAEITMYPKEADTTGPYNVLARVAVKVIKI